jgi:hypothetical protein
MRGSESWGKEGGDRGEHVGLLTLDGGGRRYGRRRTGMRPARAPMGGGTRADLRWRKTTQHIQLDTRKPPVASICSGRRRLWRIGSGGALAGGAQLGLVRRQGKQGDAQPASVRRLLGVRLYRGAGCSSPGCACQGQPADGKSPGRGGLWLGQMGLAGPGHQAGGRGSERVGPSGSAQTERIVFFEFIFNAKTIPEKSRNCLKAWKILRKSQKIQENSQS